MLLSAFCKTRYAGSERLIETGWGIKWICLLFVAGLVQISSSGYGQAVSLTLDNAPLVAAFTAIQQQTAYKFVYTKEQADAARRVTAHLQHVSLQNALEVCFKDQALLFSIEDKYIIIKTKQRKAEAAMNDSDISGHVLNATNEPLPGVTIILKGSQRGTSTDSNGFFYLPGVPEGSVIQASSIGYQALDIVIGDNRSLTIHLQTAMGGLEEMLVKGYYSTSRRLNTGSVASVSGEAIRQQPVSNLLGALEGRMPGVYIQQSSGVAGGAFSVQIRGQNSLRNSFADNGNLPLYIVDGIPFTATSLLSSLSNNNLGGGSPLNNINPSDIESVEVLKDADATSIYGSRGANGVILITTKAAHPGKTRVDMDAFAGAGKVARMLDLLHTDEYLKMRHEAFRNDAAVPGVSNYDINGVWDSTRYTDWQHTLIGSAAHLANAQLSLSGGNNLTRFLLGMGYSSETSVFPEALGDRKISSHLQLSHQNENGRFSLSFSANWLRDNNTLPNIDLTAVSMTLAPDAPPVYKDNGQLNWQNSTWTNPFASLLKKYKAKADNFLANALIRYEVFKGLQIKTSIGFTDMNVRETLISPLSSINPAFVSSGSIASSNFSTGKLSTWIAEPQLDYQHNFKKGRLNVLVGTTFQENIQQGQTLSTTGYVSDAQLENIQAATGITVVASNYVQYRYNAIFGRIGYAWKDEYIVNLTGRRDGSSRFSTGHQFANFGAIGAAWVFSNKKWIKDKLPFLDFGKLRASYGTTGSDQIPDYGYLNTYSITPYPYNGTAGLLLSRLYNADYSWELNKKLEFALELGFWHNRANFVVDGYRNRSSNQLVGYALPVITGQPSIQSNLPALVENTGWEFQVNLQPVQTRKVKWSTSINLTLPRNRLLKYPGLAASPYANTLVEGQPLSIKKNYHYTGTDAKTGLYTFQDVDANGTISFPNDLTAYKKATQSFYGGLQNSLQYKNFQLSFIFQFVRQTGYNYSQSFPLTGSANNQPAYVLDRWQNPGDQGHLQRYTQNFGSQAASAYSMYQSSDAAIGDASFIRLKNISVSYDLNAQWLARHHFQRLQFYVRAQNLLTITGYKGLDPETQNGQKLPVLRVLVGGLSMSL